MAKERRSAFQVLIADIEDLIVKVRMKGRNYSHLDANEITEITQALEKAQGHIKVAEDLIPAARKKHPTKRTAVENAILKAVEEGDFDKAKELRDELQGLLHASVEKAIEEHPVKTYGEEEDAARAERAAAAKGDEDMKARIQAKRAEREAAEAQAKAELREALGQDTESQDDE